MLDSFYFGTLLQTSPSVVINIYRCFCLLKGVKGPSGPPGRPGPTGTLVRYSFFIFSIFKLSDNYS